MILLILATIPYMDIGKKNNARENEVFNEKRYYVYNVNGKVISFLQTTKAMPHLRASWHLSSHERRTMEVL